jgi:hypothetical protein
MDASVGQRCGARRIPRPTISPLPAELRIGARRGNRFAPFPQSMMTAPTVRQQSGQTVADAEPIEFFSRDTDAAGVPVVARPERQHVRRWSCAGISRSGNATSICCNGDCCRHGPRNPPKAPRRINARSKTVATFGLFRGASRLAAASCGRTHSTSGGDRYW